MRIGVSLQLISHAAEEAGMYILISTVPWGCSLTDDGDTSKIQLAVKRLYWAIALSTSVVAGMSPFRYLPDPNNSGRRYLRKLPGGFSLLLLEWVLTISQTCRPKTCLSFSTLEENVLIGRQANQGC